MQRTISAEAGLVIAVLMITGFLVNQNPTLASSQVAPVLEPQLAATPVPEDEDLMGMLGDVMLHGTLSPAAAGDNTLPFSLHDMDGNPVEPVGNPQVTLSFPAQELGPFRHEAQSTGRSGAYAVPLAMPIPGTWEITVSVRVTRFEEARAILEVDLP